MCRPCRDSFLLFFLLLLGTFVRASHAAARLDFLLRGWFRVETGLPQRWATGRWERMERRAACRLLFRVSYGAVDEGLLAIDRVGIGAIWASGIGSVRAHVT